MKRKTLISLISLTLLLFLLQGIALASSPDVSPITSKIESIATGVLKPIGMALIFVAVAFISIRLIVMHYNPQARTSAMEGLLWVAVGALLLGGIMTVGGFLKALWQ